MQIINKTEFLKDIISLFVDRNEKNRYITSIERHFQDFY